MRPLLRFLNRQMAQRFNIALVRTAQLHPGQLDGGGPGPMAGSSIPADARDALRADHPRLVQLRERYRACDPRVTTPSIWTESKLTSDDLLYFRGDNAFVWQVRGPNRTALSYALCYYAFKADDSEGVLARLTEDAAYGVHHFTIDGRIVTRDLLDSAREIQFLLRHAGLGGDTRRILDIGAGYGRLPCRLHQATGDDVHIFATDAYAPSTFVSEYYLAARGASRASVIPLDEIDELLDRASIDLATNVHSFSECTTDAIAWWVERLARHRVRYLMVVPNEGRTGGAICHANGGENIEPIFERFGYSVKVREPRYIDPCVQAAGIDPVFLHLFELR